MSNRVNLKSILVASLALIILAAAIPAVLSGQARAKAAPYTPGRLPDWK